MYPERNDAVILQYESFLNLREDIMCTLLDFVRMLLPVTVQDVEAKCMTKFNGIFFLNSISLDHSFEMT